MTSLPAARGAVVERLGWTHQFRITLGHRCNLLFDRWYGVDTCGQQSVAQLGFPEAGALPLYHGFSSTPISTLRASLSSLPIDPREWSFVDLGCGKGRAVLLAAGLPFLHVIGVEHSCTLASIAQRNATAYSGRRRCGQLGILCADAAGWRPPASDNVLVYMFNPFSAELVRGRIESLAEAPRDKGCRRMLLFAQQRSDLTTPVDVAQLSPAAASLPFAKPPFDWLAHPQLDVALYEIRPAV